MRKLLSVWLALAVALVFAGALRAEEKKEVTLKGEILCAKCELKETKECTTAIQVKEGGKDVIYIIDDNGAKEKYHGKICKTKKKGSVKGTVTEKPKGDKPGKIKPEKDGVKLD